MIVLGWGTVYPDRQNLVPTVEPVTSIGAPSGPAPGTHRRALHRLPIPWTAPGRHRHIAAENRIDGAGHERREIPCPRIDALEGEVKRARNDIQWAIALMFVVPVGLLIILRVWS
jgi:hypothetical protein